MSDSGRKPDAPRPASTVILVREQEGLLQVYLLRRSAESSFFPGNYVFPGGGVGSHDRDSAFWGGHVDLSLGEIARRFGGGIDEEEVLPYGVSAMRETFEEAGIFLGEGRTESGTEFADAARRRVSEGLPKGWLRERVERDSWVLGFSRLARWSHWITPEAMHKRFDTRFFMAVMPPGQACSPDRKEMTHGVWLTPEQALARNLLGEIPLSPPTLVTLNELLPFASLAALKGVLESRSWGKPLLPMFKRLARGAVLIEPWDPLYSKDMEIRESDLECAVVPMGEPFSRIGYYEGIWRPIRG
jgi:8-oxo-dGTP pyrophosphatase MutT (NUDIX family)